MSKKIDTRFVIDSLRKSYSPKEWAFFEELRMGGGFADDSRQRFDAFCISYLPSRRNCSICFEVKTSRSDFLREMSNPLKKRNGMLYSHQFYFVAPVDLIKIEEVPYDCGLIEVSDSGEVLTKIIAPYRETINPTWNFIATICRRIVNESQVPESVVESTIRNVRNSFVQMLSREILKAANRNNTDLEKSLTKILNEISVKQFDI